MLPEGKKYCECNCKTIIDEYDSQGRYRRFVNGHQNRGKNNPMFGSGPKRLRENNPNYKGGKYKLRGYVKSLAPEYNKYVNEHRWTYEQYYKCCLLSYTDIHHINGRKDDNRIENLQPLIHKQHTIITNRNRVYKRKDTSGNICSECGSTETYTAKKGHKIWKNDGKGGVICGRCKIREDSRKRRLRLKLKR